MFLPVRENMVYCHPSDAVWKREILGLALPETWHSSLLAVAERYVREMGVRGLKLYPTYQGFCANDSMPYPLYAKAQQLGIPVMILTGSSIFSGTRLKYGNPPYSDDVAVDFPEPEKTPDQPILRSDWPELQRIGESIAATWSLTTSRPRFWAETL